MRNLFLATVIGFSSLAMTTPSFAESTPSGLVTDQRVKVVMHNENDVVSLTGYYGYQTTIKFGAWEKIENISIGDSIAWQVVPNSAGNLLFVKPVEEQATTNMTVITSHNVYNFELTAGQAFSPRDPRITYMLKFNYPGDSVLEFESDDPKAGRYAAASGRALALSQKSNISSTGISSVGAPRDLNFDYSYKGEDDLAPSTVFDNGEFTYFKFRDSIDVPAIFEVDKERNESVVNYHLENGYVVVESLSRQFTLRHGDAEACVFNDNFNDAKSLFTLTQNEKAPV